MEDANHKRRHKRRHSAARLPGAIRFIGEKKIEKPVLRSIRFHDKDFADTIVKNPSDLPAMATISSNDGVLWINLTGLHDVGLIEGIGRQFNIHPLALEAIADTEHHPKIQYFDDYIFLEMKLIRFAGDHESLESEQISFILGGGFVLTFLESQSEIFASVVDRIRSGGTRINRMGADFLCYSLIDSVIDSYFTILDEIEEKVEDLEEVLVTAPSVDTLRQIHNMKKTMIFLRKSIWPLREVIRKLEMVDTRLVADSTDLYIKDLYDHTIQIIETLETIRDTLSMMFDIYLSSVSNKMNEIMKVLTIIATIFIPLTFLVGVYGMNFKYMPELEWPWGYPLLWLLMVVIGGIMLWLFRRKRWM